MPGRWVGGPGGPGAGQQPCPLPWLATVPRIVVQGMVQRPLQARLLAKFQHQPMLSPAEIARLPADTPGDLRRPRQPAHPAHHYSWPAKSCIKVIFPAPLGPTIATRLPFCSSQERRAKRVRRPKDSAMSLACSVDGRPDRSARVEQACLPGHAPNHATPCERVDIA